MKITAIIPAAGTGQRMESDIAKQYMELDGKPVLSYVLKAFEESKVDEIILVVGKGSIKNVKETIVERYNIKKVKCIINGGEERYDSVYQGILKAEDADFVLIHDAARPLLNQDIINRSIEEVQKFKACVVAVPVKNTIKEARLDGSVVKTLRRDNLWSVQTPQAFSYSLIREAYDKYMEMRDTNHIHVTDDASVVELMKKTSVHIIWGEPSNIKITTPEDMVIAKALLKHREGE